MTDSEIVAKLKELIKKHKITCGEDIWQRDSLNPYEIVEEMCEIVGYYNE